MIYLDNASTTKMDPEALKTFIECSENNYFNPSSPHKGGFKNSLLLCNMRDKVKALLGIESSGGLYFCSGATEANNAILNSFARTGNKIVVSIGEHPSVLNVAKELLNKGVDVKFVGLNNDGTANLEELKQIVNLGKVDFVSIMHVSNETGAINNIEEISRICKSANPDCLVHADGVQAIGKIAVNITELNVDYYTFSAHKFGGPKGVGAFYVSKKARFKPLMLGGGQEFGMRSGTENLPGIVAMVCALDKAIKNLNSNHEKTLALKAHIMDYFKDDKDIIFNSSLAGSPYVLSMSIRGLKGEVLVHFLEQDDILIGTGSACSSKKAGNNTLQAMGLKKNDIIGSIRMSFSPENRLDEIEYACERLNDIIERQRKLQ